MALNLDWEHFLAHHWQRDHCLITRAIDDWRPPISADELAGLALEDGIESRIVESRIAESRIVDSTPDESRQAFREDQLERTHWHLQHGPFLERDYRRDDPWTLLVQAVDHYVPEVASLREYFLALPTWRLDDVMVSYAVDGGSVGPHFDHYDVFLLQGEGCRRWKVGQRCDGTSPLIEHPELRILQEFDCQAEYLLHPGDILYLPPGVAHWGIAEGDCTTFSIGFRAPRLVDLLSRRIDAQLESISTDRFLQDGGRTRSVRPGEITKADRALAESLIQATLEEFRDERWFGELVTEPRDATLFEEPAALAMRPPEASLQLVGEARVAWQQTSDTDVLVFANGSSTLYNIAVLDVLVLLCSGQALAPDALQRRAQCEHTQKLLDQLIALGAVHAG